MVLERKVVVDDAYLVDAGVFFQDPEQPKLEKTSILTGDSSDPPRILPMGSMGLSARTGMEKSRKERIEGIAHFSLDNIK